MNRTLISSTGIRLTARIAVFLMVGSAALLFVLKASGAGTIQAVQTPTRTSTRTPTRTPTRAPTMTPTPPLISFSLDQANKTNPGDVLLELFIGGTGGGPGDPVCTRNSGGALYIDGDASTRNELMQYAILTACGWKDKERVDVRLQYPNGKVVQSQKTAGSDNGDRPYVVFYFMPAWEDPTGTYHITFHGLSGEISGQVMVSRPVRPVVILFGDGRLLIYHLAPNEGIRLFAYGNCTTGSSSEACLSGWQAYRVDSQGELLLKLGKELERYTLVVLGEKSGEATGLLPFYAKGSYNFVKRAAGKSFILRPSCPGAPPQRFRINRYGEVCTKYDRVKVRQGPNRSAREIIRLEPDTTFVVIDGPVCANNWSWWKIETVLDGDIGWIAEGGDNTDPYFICPLSDTDSMQFFSSHK